MRSWAIVLVLLVTTPSLAKGPDRGVLPLGDGKISAAPASGKVWACQTNFSGGGAGRAGGWIDGAFWTPATKPHVAGEATWPQARFNVVRESGLRVLSGNSLPSHATGTFPVLRTDPAYQFDRNPNSIRERTVMLRLPALPEAASAPSCVPMGIIEIALSGVAIFNALDALGRDAPAHEMQDACDGHPERNGLYHYHDWSDCLADAGGKAAGHSDLVGYALDGFGFFRPKGEGGRVLTSADLDQCHDHTHAIAWDGSTQPLYHYHFTYDYPYTLGCFRGVPVRLPRR